MARDARSAGVTTGRLRARDLDRSVWGVRSLLGTPSLASHCAKVALRLRDDAFFSHTTAALLYGAPLPLDLERSATVHVSVAAPSPRPHARGLAGHSLNVGPDDIRLRWGLRLTSPARTWLDLGNILSLGDLVAVGDYFIHWRSAMVLPHELASMLESNSRGRGIRKLRAAMDLLSDRAESRPESLLRVILVGGGLPTPDANYVVVNTETGRDFRLDLTFRDQKLVLEYQGDYHRTKAQWRKDMTRRSRLEAQGWRVMELNADDLLDPIELVARIRMTLALAR